MLRHLSMMTVLVCAAVFAPASANAQAATRDTLTLRGAELSGRVSVSKTGSVYSLSFRGPQSGVDYQIDVAHADVRRGVIRVWERYSDSFPITVGGPTFHDTTNHNYLPLNLAPFTVLTGEVMSPNSVALDYTDTVPACGIRHRRHTFKLEGIVLSITVEDLDHALIYNGGYTGLYTGPTQGTDDPRLVLMQGALATPVILFQNGARHYFLGSTLDMFQSNAGDWIMPDNAAVVPSATSIDFSMNTSARYRPNTSSFLSASLKDTWRVAISTRVKDVLLAPQQEASPYRELLEPRTVVLLAQRTTSWLDYKTHLLQFDSWGLDDLALYCFNTWTSSADDAPALQNVGPDWFPAHDQLTFANLAATARALGHPFGAYTAFAQMPTSAPGAIYNSAHIARRNTGQANVSFQNGIPLLAATASAIHAARETLSVKQNYGLSLAYLDIQTYASPSRGADGNHIDETFGSGLAATMHDAILADKQWMRAMQDTLEGPLMGEGSIATQGSNHEWLWAGYCDSVQRVINTGAGVSAWQLALNDPRSPTVWPVIPEFELRVMKPLQCNHGNGFYDRFFSRSDSGMVQSNGTPIYPLSEAALDRYRAYEVTYGHASFFMTSGPFGSPGNMLLYADMIKEYYALKALQERYLDAPLANVRYFHNGALASFETVLFQTETTDSFRDAQVRLAYESGLVVYVNHATTNWNVSANGVAYSIPEDGYLAFEPSSAFLAFSAIPPTTGGQRIDYCLSPGNYEFFDGRGVVNSYGGIDTLGVKRLKVVNFVRGLTVSEAATGAIQVLAGNAPSIVAIDIVGPTSCSAGERATVKAVAHYANGASRVVTTLVDWSSSNPAAATVNEGGALIGVASGLASITTTSFQGVAPSPLAVVVN